MRNVTRCMLGAAALAFAVGATAQKPAVYPAKGQSAQQQRAQDQKAHAMGTFYRAYGACMEGRGYTVK